MGIPVTPPGMEALCVAFAGYWMQKHKRLPTSQEDAADAELARRFRTELRDWALAYDVACQVFPVEEEEDESEQRPT